ncbi:ATP-binding cassette domain-containing protein [Microbacterium oxydans]|nr:ATP-binding cassette domain-containing protein [Microbacterium oxydans]
MTASASDALIRPDGVTKTFGTTTALKDASLEVSRGEIVVLLGLSGSGKSTLLRHLDGLEIPTAGSVEVLGAQVPSLKGRALRDLPQPRGLHLPAVRAGSLSHRARERAHRLSVGCAGPRLGLWGYSRASKLTALEHLDRVGLLDRAYQRSDTLSGGQQQRVAIARALMQKPAILLADEPVASLDPESSEQVMALIREIAADEGLTVVCSLHQVDLAISWADRIVGLRHGEVVLDTPTGDLTKAEVMEIYGRVATTTAEIRAVAEELVEAAAQVAAS